MSSEALTLHPMATWVRQAREASTAMVIATMSFIACLGYSGIFDRWTFAVPVLFAVVGATGVAIIGKNNRWFLGEVLLATIAGFIVIGVVVTQWVPGLSSPIDFAQALANGWADLLSAQPPVDLAPSVAVVPFTTAWVTTAVAQELDRRVPVFGIAIAGVMVGLVGTSLLSVETRQLAKLQGALLIGLTLVLALMQRGRSENTAGVAMSSRQRSTPRVRAGAMLVAIGLIAALVGPRLPLAQSRDRFDLRDLQEHPWDPLEEPSPLVTLKSQLKEGARDQVMFRVRSEVPLTRLTLAVLQSYDGVVWEVADPNADAPAQFVPVDSQLPEHGGAGGAGGAASNTVVAEIEIVNLDGPWVPHGGSARSVRFGDTAGAADVALRLNLATSTLAAPSGLAAGDRYTLTTAMHPQISEQALERAKFVSSAEATELSLVPAPILNLAAELVAGADLGGPQVQAIRDLLVTEGFYDAGRARPPGHSYAQIAAFIDDPTRVVGYEEQYAATAAVLARAAGVPTRVAVGYLVDQERARAADGAVEITGDDATAWIEVLVEGTGWVPVDVTPDRTRVPTDELLGRITRNVAVLTEPPPPPPPLDADQLDDPEDDDEEEDDEEEVESDEPVRRSLVDLLLDRPGVVAGTVALSPLVVFAALAALVAGLKMRRTRRRKTAPTAELRVAGAWAETIDRFQEAGHEVSTNAAPLEIAEELLLDEGLAPAEPALRELVALVSRSAFAKNPPTVAEVDQAWSSADDASESAMAELDVWQRLRMKADPRPLLRPSPDADDLERTGQPA